jgi:hypothetical protein
VDLRKKYLTDMADLLEGKLTCQEGEDSVYSIVFLYEGQSFTYQDVEEQGFNNCKIYKGLLRASSGYPLTVTFTEKPRSAVVNLVASVKDLANPWMDYSETVKLDKPLNVFSIYTNNTKKTNELFDDEDVFKVFASFKSQDFRGHPMMALEIVEGELVLKFNPPGEMKPSLLDLQHNVSSIDVYLKRMSKVVDKLKKMAKEQEN